MGASVRPDPIDAALAQIRSAAPSVDPMDAALAEIRRSGTKAPAVPSAAADASRALPFNRPGASGDVQSLSTLPTAAMGAEASLARGIAPLALAQNALRALVRGQSYDEAKQDIDTATGMLHPMVRGVIQGVGAAPAAMMLPTATLPQAAASGALLGASQGMDEPTKETFGGLAKNTAIGAGAGAALYGAGQMIQPAKVGLKSLTANDPDEALTEIAKQRKIASSPGYRAFRNLGDLGNTPELNDLVGDGTATNPGLPIVRRAIETVKGESPTLAKLPDTDARVLDAVYKRIGNKAFQATNGFEAGEARESLLDAMEKAAQAKGGSYAEPVGAYREGSQQLKAFSRGRDVINNAVSGTGGSEKAALEKSPAAFKDWFPNASPAEQDQALQGLYSQIGRRGTVDWKSLLGTKILPVPSPALRAGVGVVNSVQPPQMDVATMLKLLAASQLGMKDQ